MSTLYDTDVVAWALEQVDLLRRGKFAELDIENIASEIEEVGKNEHRGLASRLTVLLGQHYLQQQQLKVLKIIF